MSEHKIKDQILVFLEHELLKPTVMDNQCCREILFLFNRLFRDISRNEDLIAIFISRYIIIIYYQL